MFLNGVLNLELTAPKLEYTVNKADEGAIPVIIVAAGSSSRMGGINKLTVPVSGVPVLARTLAAFENCPMISGIILAVRSQDILNSQLMAEQYGISKLTDVICGGNTRAETVARGIARLGKNDEYVLIHDGARPIVTDEIITETAAALKSFSAVACAVPVKDTVKCVDKNGVVIKTLDRSGLFAVQTPQGVNVRDYKAAAEKAGEGLKEFTDDASVMEAAGYTVHITRGSYANIKITTREDIALAEYLLNGENKE